MMLTFLLLAGFVLPFPLDKQTFICIESIQNRFFKDDLIYMVNFSNIKFNFPHVSYKNSTDFMEFIRTYPQTYIINLHIDDSLEGILADIDLLPNFNPRAKFLFVSNQIPSSFSIVLRKYYIFNAVFLHFEENLVYVQNQNEFKPIGDCLDLNQTIFEAKTVQIDSLNVTYMFRPPYSICAYCKKKRKGIELAFLHIISECLNLTVHYTKSEETFWGTKRKTSYLGAYNILDERKTEMLVGLFTIRDEEIWDFDPVPTYLVDHLNFVVPKARPIPKWLKLLHLFKWRVWLAYFSTAILFYIVWMAFIKLGRREKFTSFQIFAYIYQVLTEVVPKLRPVSVLFRILCIFWLFQVLLLNTAMKTRLIYVLSGNIYEKQVDSWQDIVDSKYMIGLNDYIRSLFNDGKNPLEEHFSHAPVTCDYSWNCTSRVAFERNIVTAKFANQIDYYGPKYFSDEDGKALLHLSSYVINSMYTSFIFIKGHPLVPKFRYNVGRVSEHGFVNHFLKESERENYISQKLANAGKTGLTVQPLGLKEFAFPFIVLGFGSIFSIVVFYMEIVVNKIENK